jgi:hypothetical protein
MIVISISAFGQVGCGRPLRGARHRNIQSHAALHGGQKSHLSPQDRNERRIFHLRSGMETCPRVCKRDSEQRQHKQQAVHFIEMQLKFIKIGYDRN